MDLERIIAKLDTLVETGDFEGAKELLKYWIDDAILQKNKRGELTLCNESMGLYRKLADKENACIYADMALSLVDELELKDTLTDATTCINAATVYKAFGEAAKGLPLFEHAREIYEKELKDNDGRLGGLYNNMGLSLLDVGRYEDSVESYKMALEVMKKVKNGNLESAVTYMNIADVCDRVRKDPERKNEHTEAEWEEAIDRCLKKAEECLNDETLPRNSYYAFVADKCAPGFGYYGYFMMQKILEDRVKEILDKEKNR